MDVRTCDEYSSRNGSADADGEFFLTRNDLLCHATRPTGTGHLCAKCAHFSRTSVRSEDDTGRLVLLCTHRSSRCLLTVMTDSKSPKSVSLAADDLSSDSLPDSFPPDLPEATLLTSDPSYPLAQPLKIPHVALEEVVAQNFNILSEHAQQSTVLIFPPAEVAKMDQPGGAMISNTKGAYHL